jgi:hypothetical protein
MKHVIDLSGQRFSKLIVLNLDNRKNNKTQWKCRCDCGNLIVINGENLKNGHTKSCGCLIKRANGKSKTPTYYSWQSMISRCYKPNNNRYRIYGSRGIKVCEEWRNSFKTFFRDMGERPPGTTLDRKNNNGDYCKENCHWATNEEQANNKRTTCLLEFNGQFKTIGQWAQIFKINVRTLNSRIARGWPISKALLTPLRSKFYKKEELN